MLMEVLKHCANARTMATVAQHVSAEKLASGGPGQPADGRGRQRATDRTVFYNRVPPYSRRSRKGAPS